MEEVWKDVVGWEGLYQVSSLGRVKSLSRKYSPKEKYLKPYKSNKYGHCVVNLCYRRYQRLAKVHSIVIEAFLGSKKNGEEVCHNNGDPTDNKLVNLRYDTHRNNQNDMRRHGTLCVGSSSSLSKLTEKKVCIIKKLLSLKFKQKTIAKMFDTTQPNISQIASGITWKHVQIREVLQ